MLTDNEIEHIAETHVLKTYPSDCEILRREKRSQPEGVYFEANHPAHDPLEQYVGSGGFFVSRQTGEIWEFGSGQLFNEGLEYWLQFYAEGWRPGTYRFTQGITVRYGRSRLGAKG